MEILFTYILKVNALILLFYLVYQLALSKETFYKHSRWFLLSGLFISLLLPFVTFTKIEYYEVKRVLNNSIENNVPQMVQISQEAAQEPMLTNQEILLLIYGIICFGFFIKTILDFFKLFKIIKVSNSEKKNKLVYINTNLVHTPFSFFNYIVFNEELINPVELQNIIKHEEAHSMQKHSFDTLLAQFFIILFWFNPIVWLYRKSIVQNLEFLADSFAIQQVSDRTIYQKTMLKITMQPQKNTIINTFNQSSIKKRIIMLNTNQSNRKNIWKFGIILPFVTAFMLLFQIETIAQEKKSKTETKKAIESFSYIFEKQYDDSTIKNYINEIEKKHNLTLVVADVKRNSENEIIAINFSVKTKDGKKINHIVQGDSPIGKFAIKIIKNNGNETIEIVENFEKTIVKNGDWKEVETILNKNNSEDTSTKKSNLSGQSNNEKLTSFSMNVENGTIADAYKNSQKNTLFIVNGKEMRRSEIKYKSINVEGEIIIYDAEEAVAKFGEKGKDGVFVLNGKTTFLNEEKGEFNGNELVFDVTIELDNGDIAIMYKNNFLKLGGGFPSIDFSSKNNKIYIDEKYYNLNSFNSFEHKKLKKVNVLKEFKDDVLIGYLVYFTTK